MKAPMLDDKGKVIKEPEDLIQNQLNDDSKRDEWLNSHYILV